MALSHKAAHRISLVAGLGIVILSIASQIEPGVAVCGTLAKGYAPVLAFELARTIADLHAIFGDAPSVCRTVLAAQMDNLTLADSLAFIPVYGIFLIFFFLGTRRRDLGLARLALAATVAALLSDYVENACLLKLSAEPDVASLWLSLLPWATGAKWILLGAANVLGGAILLKPGNAINYSLALLCFLGAAVTLLAIAMPASFGPNVANGIALGWLVFLGIDARDSFRHV